MCYTIITILTVYTIYYIYFVFIFIAHVLIKNILITKQLLFTLITTIPTALFILFGVVIPPTPPPLVY